MIDDLLESITAADIRRLKKWAPVFLSFSGGKDSTATALLMREVGIPFTPVFADTRWEEGPATKGIFYGYLDEIEKHIGKIERCGFPGGMKELVRQKRMFSPKAMGKFCTRVLKQIPLAQRMRELSGSNDHLIVVGIRHEESKERQSAMKWDGATFRLQKRVGSVVLVRDSKPVVVTQTIFRPLIHWTVEDVVRIHRALNVPMNPLYAMGAKRVGCWPCNQLSKKAMKRFGEMDPKRVEEVSEFEQEMAKIRGPSNSEATFFLRRVDTRFVPGPWTIHEHLKWARNAWGGIQPKLPGVEEPADESCGVMGLCDGGYEA